MVMSRILLVEDDCILNQDLSHSLKILNYDVRSTHSGVTAFEAIDSHEHFLALITDIDLGPGPNGVDVARYARAFYPHLPVVFISGRDSERDADHGVMGSAFIPKPLQPVQVADALARLIRLQAA